MEKISFFTPVYFDRPLTIREKAIQLVDNALAFGSRARVFDERLEPPREDKNFEVILENRYIKFLFKK